MESRHSKETERDSAARFYDDLIAELFSKSGSTQGSGPKGRPASELRNRSKILFSEQVSIMLRFHSDIGALSRCGQSVMG